MTQTNGGQRLTLTLGPLLFNWPADTIADFYARIADEAPVDTVCIGEVVCSKRSPFHVDALAAACERLERAGKQVMLSALSLITLKRERADCAALMASPDHDAEINDLTALAYLGDGGRTFGVGPFVNLYNEGTLEYLVDRGARRFCFPPELPMAAVSLLCARAAELGAVPEVWAFGRTPLALSGRCYHARLHGLNKDSCQFVCERDQDGLDVRTLDEQPLLAINGVQTLSYAYCNLIGDLAPLREIGVQSLRLSPQSCDMVAVAGTFRAALDGRMDAEEAFATLGRICGPVRFANGFLMGAAGMELSRRQHA